MKAGRDREGENYDVDGGQVIAGVVGDTGGEHDDGDSDYLDGGVRLAEPRRTEASKSGHDIDGGGSHHNEDVAADDCNSYPERDGQVAGHRLRKYAAHRQDDERRDHHQLIGDGIQHGSQL